MEKALNIEPKASNTEKILAVKDLLVTDSKINDAVKLAKENPPLSKDEMKKAVMGAATDLFESRRLYDAAYLVGFFRKNGTLTNDDMVSFEQKVMPWFKELAKENASKKTFAALAAFLHT